MQKVLPAFLVFAFFCVSTYSQEFKITGKVVDAVSEQPLEATTIYAESPKDSALVAYTISDEIGSFTLEDRSGVKEVNLFFSYNGYKTKVMKVELKDHVKLGTLLLEEQAEELKGVSVVGDRVPITIKKDTLEFNADSFKTRPDATVEELLKKLPGVEVDGDGKIMVNGKEVSQVLVNGQVFFSNDPKMATKSLPKDIISKIQITDTKTKAQEFTGESGDGSSKTINLMIKEDMNKGILSRLTAGYGTDERYQANALFNYFNGDERFSLVAASNNINSAGFSFDEIYDMIGRTRGGGFSVNRDGGFSIAGLNFGFGEGITTSNTLGASYANSKKGEYEITGNYFFASSDSYNDERMSRENILPSGSFFTDRESSFEGNTVSNRGGANLIFDIDKTLRVTLSPSMSVNRTSSVNASSTRSSTENNGLLNENENLTSEDGVNRNFSNRFDITKKLDTLGTYVRLFFNNGNEQNNNESRLNTVSRIFGENARTDERNQNTEFEAKNDSYEVGFDYRQALAKKLFLELGYEQKEDKNSNIRSVFDLNEVAGTYSDFNSALSSDFLFKTSRKTPSIGIKKDTEKLRLGLDMEYQFSDLDNTEVLRSTSFSKSYKNILFRGYVNYNLDKSKRIGVHYNSGVDLPRINQLQPVANVSNPLNVVTGNPDLEPSISRNLYFNYNNFNWKERTGLFVYVGLNYQDNLISSVTETDEDLLRRTTYTNVDGNYNHYGGLGYSKEIKKDSTFKVKFNFRPYFNLQKNVGFVNGQRLEAKRNSFSPRITTTLNFKEFLEIEPGYSINLNSTKYNLDSYDDINFTSHNAELKTTLYWPKNVIWGNDIRYNYNGSVGNNFDKDAVFWNMSLGVQMFKKSATLKLLAYDLLNQNINTKRITGQDFIQDEQGTVLTRYFMMSLTYKFDQFGGKKSKEGNRFMF
ncbi:CarboxypepD_reg-like domain-containing protein [Zobellia uliginosa]|uniref:CarboxypepD_reg-like domain-containing protein n=1 Tax=Zobellia uliginosa TaxID=143224 RepID=A0ABY1L1X7_9FLAO|nr:outer membrane beta-barrel protein [Zobellia uliginosa]SIT13229.1 CarboxypepD_reg-like domain-containing protein [Zobellia uliginosa]